MVSDSATGKTRILVDLKPAFDGYSGIPQETRLLYWGLRQLAGYETRGLLQHGSSHLSAGLPRDDDLPAGERIHRLSQVIASITEHAYAGKSFQKQFLRELALRRLESRTRRGHAVPTSLFDAAMFGDFTWRALFEKTLAPGLRKDVESGLFHVVQPSRQHFQKVGLRSLRSQAAPRFPRLDTGEFDLFLAQTPFPGELSPTTRMVVRYHDAVPLRMPHTIRDKSFHLATHYQALRANVRAGAWFSCISEATRADLLALFPEVEARSEVIPNIVAGSYDEDEHQPPGLVTDLIRNRAAASAATGALPGQEGKPLEYLLVVATLEPRKNHHTLISAWETLRYRGFPDLKLVLVGSPGWEFQPILDAMAPWARRGELFHLENVPARELQALYRHAALTVCPSLFEGFDYPGVEAMRCGCPVAASDIPVHREVYADAADYFDPYDIDAAAEVLARMLRQPSAERAGRTARGREISRRYTPEHILPQWAAFLERARGGVHAPDRRN